MRALLLALALVTVPMMAQQQKPLRPAMAEERMVRAAVVIADYRYDDLLWENDRIA